MKRLLRRLLFKEGEQRYWCWSWIFFNPFEKTFHNACKQHDIDYAESKMTRKRADERFLYNMIADIPKGDWKLWWTIKAYIHTIRALLYYLIARVVGKLFQKK